MRLLPALADVNNLPSKVASLLPSAEGSSVAQFGREWTTGQSESLFFKKRDRAGPRECTWDVLVSRFCGFDRVTPQEWFGPLLLAVPRRP